MSGNSIGKRLVLTSFGESHGPATGGVLDGFPARIKIDPGFIQNEINRRNPANYPFSTPRKEKDEIEILSGLLDNVTTGAPIAFIIRNTDQRPADYDHLKGLYRPSHADLPGNRNSASAITAAGEERPHALPWHGSLQGHLQRPCWGDMASR